MILGRPTAHLVGAEALSLLALDVLCVVYVEISIFYGMEKTEPPQSTELVKNVGYLFSGASFLFWPLDGTYFTGNAEDYWKNTFI